MSLEHFYNLITYTEDINMSSIIKEAEKFTENLKYKGMNLITITIYYNFQNIFDMFIEKGFNINLENDNGIPALIWAMDSTNSYYKMKLLHHPKINYFQNGFYDNFVSYVFSEVNDINFFNLMIKKFKEIDFDKAQELSKEKTSNIIEINSFFTKQPLIFRMIKMLNISLSQSNIDYEEIEDIFFKKLDVLKEFDENFITYTNFDRKILKYTIEKSNLRKQFILKFTKLYFNNYYFKYNRYPKLKEYNDIFMNTIENKNTELFKYLIDIGIKYDISNIYKECLKYKNMDFIIIILEKNGIKYFSELIKISIECHSLKLLKYLHQNGVEIDDDTEKHIEYLKYSRPLHLALKNGSYEIINYIIENTGDELDFKGRCSKTPRDVLEEEYRKGNISQEIVEMIVKPILTYNKFKQEAIKFESARECQECCICLENINMKPYTLLECGHIFHTDCIMKNCNVSSRTCPYCRQEIQIKCNSKIDLGKYIKKKIIKKVRRNSLSNLTQFIIPKISRKIKEYEDKYELEMLCLKDYDEYITKYKENKKKGMICKMDRFQRNEDIHKLRNYLIRQKIGYKKKYRVKPFYNEEYNEEIFIPPSSPLPIKRMEPISNLKKEVNTNNIIQSNDSSLRRSIRSTRGKRPQYLLDEC